MSHSAYFVELKALAHDKISFADTFAPGAIDIGLENVRQVGPLDWSASAERADEDIRINGSLATTVELVCSRCLEPAQYGIDKPFDLFFRERDAEMFDEDEIELDDEDTRTAF